MLTKDSVFEIEESQTFQRDFLKRQIKAYSDSEKKLIFSFTIRQNATKEKEKEVITPLYSRVVFKTRTM